MKMNFKKGFTLIELLVVVAIIGILASVVLASLNSARAKGSDAAVKANLSGIRANAELQYDTLNGCYGDAGVACSATIPAVQNPGLCPTSGTGDSIFALPSINLQLVAADSAGGTVACSSTVGGTAWAVIAGYKSDILKGWCVDSTGKSKEVPMADNTVQGNSNLEVAAGACVD